LLSLIPVANLDTGLDDAKRPFPPQLIDRGRPFPPPRHPQSEYVLFCYTLQMIQETFSDTPSEVDDILIALLRKAPAWRKFKMVGELNATVKQFALAGIRQRHPNATEREVERHLADLLLGEELAAKVYGEWHVFQST
jgi:hypothetical protein